MYNLCSSESNKNLVALVTDTMQSLYNALGFIIMNCVISESYYKGTILQRNYRKMTFCKIPW